MANYNITEFPIVATPIGDTVQQTEVDSVLALKNNEIAKVSVDDLKEQMHVTSTAEEVSYDNTNSGLVADNVQSAIDETTRNAKATERSLKALWKVSEGQIYDTETVTGEAYQRTVPSGGFYADVKKVGGKSVVSNNLIDPIVSDTVKYNILNAYPGGTYGNNLITFAPKINGLVHLRDNVSSGYLSVPLNHKILYLATIKTSVSTRAMFINDGSSWQNVNATADGAWHDYSLVVTHTALTSQGQRFAQSAVDDSTATIEVKNIRVVDLTQYYGGNVPSTIPQEDLDAIKSYLESHPEYNSGELVSADVDKVVSESKNILYPSSMHSSTINGITLTNNGDGSYTLDGTATGTATFFIFQNNFPLKAGSYYFGCENAVANDHYAILNSNGAGYKTFGTAFTISADETLSYVGIQVPSGKTVNATMKPYITKGTTATAYTPYFSESSLIPSALRTEHPLKSAVAIQDEWDLANKKCNDSVGEVDLGDLNWTYETNRTNPFFRTTKPSDCKTVNSNEGLTNAICPIYERRASSTIIGNTTADKCFNVSGWEISNNYIYILDRSFTDAQALKESLAGIKMYYELATPIETDISSYFADSDPLWNVLDVEGGGTLTMHQTETEIPVPNEIQYGINLSEVGA